MPEVDTGEICKHPNIEVHHHHQQHIDDDNNLNAFTTPLGLRSLQKVNFLPSLVRVSFDLLHFYNLLNIHLVNRNSLRNPTLTHKTYFSFVK